VVLNRNTVILFIAQCMFVSGTVLMVTVGGIVGSAMSPAPIWTTLPMSLMVVGTAVAAIPASLLMQRFGRRAGFVSAALLGVGASQLGAWSLNAESVPVFCTTALLIGISIAFSQQFRFAAAESVPAAKVSQAISFILLGSIGGAFLGPELAAQSPNWTPEQPFRGGFLAASGCYLIAALVLLGVRVNTSADAGIETEESPRSLRSIILLPVVTAAVLAGVVGQGVMTFVMTATPVSMHVVDGHTLADTASVIRAHVLAMYLPSLFSGFLISWFGVRKIMFLGLATLTATIGLGILGHQYLHYWGTLVLLGIGWNLLFVGGTTLLVSAYRPAERFRVQALNDFSVFGVSALASLLGGAVLLQLGWESVLVAATAPLLVMLVVLLRLTNRQIANAQPAT
jgi:MFS family permease